MRTGRPTLSPVALPRARALTDALLAPEGDPPPEATAAEMGERLTRGLAEVLANAPAGVPGAPRRGRAPCARVGAFDLARAGPDDRSDGGGRTAGQAASARRAQPDPFRWSARTARRKIGLAAVRICADGCAASPVDAVTLVMADPAGPSGLGPNGPGSCADWLASLAPPARALVQAEAVTWATRLWTAIEWPRVTPRPVVGGADRWWHWNGAVRVALRGRADVRVPGPRGAQLSVVGGSPAPAARSALCLAALVDVLTRGAAHAPSRVVGWWPDCGKVWLVPVNRSTLQATVDHVLRAVARVAGNGAPPAS